MREAKALVLTHLSKMQKKNYKKQEKFYGSDKQIAGQTGQYNALLI